MRQSEKDSIARQESLKQALVALEDAAREFVAKVESGQAYSVKSYAAFKGALLALDQARKG